MEGGEQQLDDDDSLDDVRERGWGRHDNDSADYRSIRLVPTAGEVRILYCNGYMTCTSMNRSR